MKKLISTITVFALSMFFVSCGSSVSCNTTAVAGAVTIVNVKGAVSDGTVDAIEDNVVSRRAIEDGLVVTFQKLDGTTLETQPNEVKVINGIYEANITTPLKEGEQYRVTVGDMSSIVTNEANSTIGNVSPATTMVSSMVEDGALPTEAQDVVNDSFGLDKGTDLAKLDPTKEGVANKIAKLIALLSESIPKVEKKVVIESITTVIKKKKIKIRVSAVDVVVDDLNLSEIAKEAGATDENIEKVRVIESLIIKQVVKVVKTVTTTEAVSSHSALLKFLDELVNQEIEELDVDVLQSLIDSLDDSIAKVLADKEIDLASLTPDDIDFILELIKGNIDDDIVTTLKSYKKVVKKTTTIKVKKVIKYTYLNSKASKVSDIEAKLDDDLLAKLDDMQEDADEEVADIMSDMLGARLAQNIEDGDADVEGALKDIIANVELVETIKIKVKIKQSIKVKVASQRTKEEKVQLIAVKKVVKDIKINIKVKEFTETTSTNADKLFDEVVKDLLDNEDTLLERIKALSLMVENLNELFNAVEYQERTTVAVKTIQSIKIDKTVNVVKTIEKLSIKVVEKFVESDGKEELDLEDDKLLDEVKVELPPRVITLPLPTLKSMPESLKASIKITL